MPNVLDINSSQQEAFWWFVGILYTASSTIAEVSTTLAYISNFMDQLSFSSKVLAGRIKEMHLECENVIYVRYETFLMDIIKCTVNTPNLFHIIQHLIVVLMV